MQDFPPSFPGLSSDPQRTRFFALLGQDHLVQHLSSSFFGFDVGLLYLHLLCLPAPYWDDDTVEFADLQQLVETLNAEKTIAFLCARIDEVWQLTNHLQTLLRAVPYSELFAQGEPRRDELLTKALRSLASSHQSFTPELTQLFLQLLADEFARQWVGDTLFLHAKQELHYIAQARFLHRSLTQHGANLSPIRKTLDQLEEKGLIVQETATAHGLVRLRLLPVPPVEP